MSTTTTDVRTTSRGDIAANVRAELARKQLEQKDIAAALGKSNAAISERMNARLSWRIDELQAIAQLLDVTLDQLLQPATEQASA